MLKSRKKLPVISSIAFWIGFTLLACQVALMPQGRYDAMIGHLEANKLGDTARAGHFQLVISLAGICRRWGPLAVAKQKRKDLIVHLKKAYVASIVLWQMEQLGE